MANYDLTYEGSRVQGILDTGNSLKDAGYIFRGEATPSTVPGTPTERVAYIGGPGTYTNFGSSITVGAGCICVFKYTGSAWSNQVINTGLDSAVNTLQSAITAINNNIGNGYVYAGVATPSTSPVTGKVFYLAVQAGTYTNFGNAVVTAGLNVIKYNGSAWSVDQVIAIDAEPTQGSANLVKSGGVLNSIIQNGPSFDLSAYNAQGGVLATYADLSAALTALNALPADFKKGGMSMKYVQTSDNNYERYNLIANEFTTDTTQWAIDDNGVYVNNPEYIEAKTDKEGKLIEGIKSDGTKYIAGNLQVEGDIINEVTGIIENNKTSIENIDNIINNPLNTTPHGYFSEQINPEWLHVETDNEGKVLGGRREDGMVIENVGIETKNAVIDFSDIDTLKVNEDIVLSDEVKEKLEKIILNPNYELLQYHKDAVNNYADNVFVEQGDSSFVIAFMTDMHLTRHDNSPIGTLQGLMAYGMFVSKLFTDINILGGDYTDTVYDGRKQVTAKDVSFAIGSCIELTNPAIPKIMLRGNHEFENFITERRFHNLASRLYPNGIVSDSVNKYRNCGYIDNDDKKVRLVFFDTYLSSSTAIDNQLEWLANTALNLEGKTDYTVIVFSHAALLYTGPIESYANYRKVLSAFHRGQSIVIDGVNYDFSGQGAIPMVYIAGHMHSDFSYNEPQNDSDFLTIITMHTSTIWDGDRTLYNNIGTVEECAFDTFIVNPTNKTIKVLRYGYGNDRTFNYD